MIEWLRKWVWIEMKKSLGFGLEVSEVEKGGLGWSDEGEDVEKEMNKREEICITDAFFSIL
jgi:hypothetical protein